MDATGVEFNEQNLVVHMRTNGDLCDSLASAYSSKQGNCFYLWLDTMSVFTDHITMGFHHRNCLCHRTPVEQTE